MFFSLGPSGLNGRLRLSVLLIATGGGLSMPFCMTQASEFQSGFMQHAGAQGAAAAELALTHLGNEHSLGPGRYLVAILVNRSRFDERELDFELDPAIRKLSACLTPDLLREAGLRLDSLARPLAVNTCVDLPRLFPGAMVEFDSRQLVLSVSVPQIAMRRDVQGYIDPARWDAGINAAFINYQASAQQGFSRYNGRENHDDLYLNGGFNLAGWRLRSSQTLRRTPQGEREWTRAYTYLQRDLPGTHANLTLGETFTSGDVFKSLPIKGLVIATDLAMLPDALQGYAPIIRGVANSRARLEILQNGYPVYSTYVSPGPYQIDDLSIAGGSGELEVVLTEEDGQVRRFTQPYATLGNLMRQGVWRYSGSIGRYNAAGNLDDPLLMQGSLAFGTAWDFTLYGGLQAGSFYRAGNLGAARNLGALGALAVDVTRSATDLDTSSSGRVSGMSYAIKYGKAFDTDTTLRFAGYRYSTVGYRDFDEAVRERSHDRGFHGSRRSRLEAAMFQNFGPSTSVSLTLSKEDFWNTTYQQRQFQFNLTHQHRGVSYNLFASQSLSDERSDHDRQFGISISLPLDLGHSNSATFNYLNSGGRLSQNARLTGSMDQNRLSYSAGLSNDDQRRQTASFSAAYQAPFASLGAGLSQGSDYRSLSLNASGAVLLHADGVELGPYLSETAALVHVPDIAGVGLNNAAGAKTNARGYALLPHLRPYRVNHMALKTDDLGPDVEIENGTAQVVPRRGAIVKTTFEARKVTRIVLSVSTPQGSPVPFGTQVKNDQGAVLGIAGQGGQILLATDDKPQTLEVYWGEQPGQRCQLDLDPEAMERKQGYRLQSLTCRP